MALVLVFGCQIVGLSFVGRNELLRDFEVGDVGEVVLDDPLEDVEGRCDWAGGHGQGGDVGVHGVAVFVSGGGGGEFYNAKVVSRVL